MSSCFIYYRVQERFEDSARATVLELLDRVRLDTGVQGRWMRKLNEPLLWMEIYEGIDDRERFATALGHAVQAIGLNRFLLPDPTRKEEHFVTCA